MSITITELDLVRAADGMSENAEHIDSNDLVHVRGGGVVDKMIWVAVAAIPASVLAGIGVGTAMQSKNEKETKPR